MSHADDQLNWNDYGACTAGTTDPPDSASSRDRNPYTGSGPIREFLVDRLMGWGISQANLIADDLLESGVIADEARGGVFPEPTGVPVRRRNSDGDLCTTVISRAEAGRRLSALHALADDLDQPNGGGDRIYAAMIRDELADAPCACGPGRAAVITKDDLTAWFTSNLAFNGSAASAMADDLISLLRGEAPNEPPDPASSRDRNPYTGSGPIREFLVDRLMGWGISQANLIADDLLESDVLDAEFHRRLTELANDEAVVQNVALLASGVPLTDQCRRLARSHIRALAAALSDQAPSQPRPQGIATLTPGL